MFIHSPDQLCKFYFASVVWGAASDSTGNVQLWSIGLEEVTTVTSFFHPDVLSMKYQKRAALKKAHNSAVTSLAFVHAACGGCHNGEGMQLVTASDDSFVRMLSLVLLLERCSFLFILLLNAV